MKRLSKWLYILVPFSMLCAALTLHLRAPWLVEGVRLHVFDAYQRVKPRRYTPAPVRIIDVDEESLQRLGQWPWPRTRIAKVLEKARSGAASVVVVDFLFAEPDRTSPEQILPLWPATPATERLRNTMSELPDHDAILADAIEQTPTVTGFVLTHEGSNLTPLKMWTLSSLGLDHRTVLPKFGEAILNLPTLDAGALGSGSFNIVPERDGINRRAHLMFLLNDAVYPSLAAEAIRVAQREDSYAIKAIGASEKAMFGAPFGIDELKIGNLTVPTDAQGRVWLHYTRPEPRRYVPAWRFLEDDFDLSSIAGHIILLGTSAVGLKDVRATPLDPVASGIEIHASVIEQILLGEFLLRPGWAEPAELLYLVVLALILILMLPKLRAFGSAAVGGIAAAFAVGLSWFAYSQFAWLVDPVLPSLVVLLLYIVGTFINFVQTETERRHVRAAFGHYLAPSVIEKLMAEPGLLRLGGEKRETTFLFSDIAGFTSLTERIEPTELVRLLNGYLEGTCKIVLKHGGTIDKIVGDALHVMFNAPSDQEDHADRAVMCALELDTFCRAYQDEQEAYGFHLGMTRIGVNSGSTVVGNFGGADRFDYTAHGDAINTAARLESVNKYFGTRICISVTTKEQCHYEYFRPVGRLQLKGKTMLLEVFEPLTKAEVATDEHKAYLAAYSYLDESADAALAAFQDLSRRRPGDALIAFHLRRLESGERGTHIVMADK